MEKKIKFTFKKEEKLKKKKEIDRLFKKGKSFHVYPLRWIYLKNDDDDDDDDEIKFPVRMGVSVSKKKFKRATQRNRIKRLMREAWRLNKHKMYKKLDDSSSYSIMLIYTGKEEMPFHKLEEKMKDSIRRFLKKNPPRS